MINDYFKIFITVFTAALGWYVVYYLNTIRDQSLKRKDITINHLINAYRILTHEITHRNLTIDQKTKLESIVSDIQLFGSEKQIKLVKELVDDIVTKDEFTLDRLINDLRTDLRKQLGLTNIPGNVRWLRIDDSYRQVFEREEHVKA